MILQISESCRHESTVVVAIVTTSITVSTLTSNNIAPVGLSEMHKSASQSIQLYGVLSNVRECNGSVMPRRANEQANMSIRLLVLNVRVHIGAELLH